MLNEKDFEIQMLGKADILSPFKLSTTRGDGIANFVEDYTKIPYCLISPCTPGAEGLFFEHAGPREKIYFQPKDVTAAIMTCGGLCPGLNNAIRSIVMQLFYKYNVRKILGIRYGQKGLDPSFGHEPIKLTPEGVVKIHEIGGSFLGTSRGKVDPGVMVDSLVKYNINILLCLGGDGTQKGLHEIYKVIEKRKLKIAVVGIPKTIDNDISYVYKTFGLDTAVTVAKEAVRSAHCEAESAYNGIGLVKVMGRQSGYIAALTTLANNDVNMCLIPEIPFDLHGNGAFLKVLEARLASRHHAVIVIAEGAGQELFTNEKGVQIYDASGNVRMNDIGLLLKKK
ncbi:MAG: ATP-dependent 6-phosphofructokinase, partial [Candidatus Omnitrophica bacterium]|nr:ATP-dependent 6-phosphofructokinase [Candidatus Omnitrophota bacterium]